MRRLPRLVTVCCCSLLASFSVQSRAAAAQQPALPALGYQAPAAEPAWRASWIWLAGEDWTVNVHLLARKEFVLRAKPEKAALRISSYSDYLVYINGKQVGRGPEWNDPEYQTYDVYDVRKLLASGSNVVAVVLHNYGLGLHWSHRGRGGLIAELDIDDGKQVVSTDASWKIKKAEAWAKNTPRIFWSAGFLETFDFNRYDPRWMSGSFDDSAWSMPEVIGQPPVRPWIRLLKREIPLLEETLLPMTAVEKGSSTLPPLHAVRFDPVLPSGRAALRYAGTMLYSKKGGQIGFHIECDDAFRLFLNAKPIASFNYDQQFSRTRVWRGKDEYDQAHYGMGTITYSSRPKEMFGRDSFGLMQLQPGANELLMVTDQGVHGWGFLLKFVDPGTKKPVAVDFGTGTTHNQKWMLAGPYTSTGFSNSLDRAATSWKDLNPKIAVDYSPFTYSGVTDYATIAEAEERVPKERLSGNEAVLHAGEYAIFALDRVHPGFPEFEIESEQGGILDVGYTQILTPDRRLGRSAYGMLRYVDRVVAAPGEQLWQPLERRTARYVFVSCRKGDFPKIRMKGWSAIGYPAKLQASFESSDALLNRIWETSVYTDQLVMQQGYQDCLKREQGTLNTSSFNFASRGAAYTFGDYALARKTLLQGIRTQDKTGWFDSHGISSPNNDEITECLWWAVWLKDYYMQSGDIELVRDVYESLEDNLRYFAKSVDEYGLIAGRNRPIFWQGQQVYLDDTNETGKYNGNFDGELLGFNLLYAAALRSAAFLGGDIGLSERADYYTRRASWVEESVNGRFWDAKRKLYRDWRDGDRLAETYNPIFQITASYFDLAKKVQAAGVLQYLTQDLGLPDENKTKYPLNTFGYYHYFLEVLFRNGRDAEALNLMRRFYGRWLELGGTTFGEFLNLSQVKGQKMLDTEYEVHAYGTSALVHFYSNILGAKATKPGFAEIEIAPHPGDLKWARGTFSTPRGAVNISWRTEGEIFYLDVNLPEDCRFKVRPPQHFERYDVRVNNKIVEASALSPQSPQ